MRCALRSALHGTLYGALRGALRGCVTSALGDHRVHGGLASSYFIFRHHLNL